MLPTLKRYWNVGNDYETTGPSHRGGAVSDLHTLRAIMERVSLPTYERVGVTGLDELHILTDEGATVIAMFDEDGALLVLEVEGTAARRGAAEEDVP